MAPCLEPLTPFCDFIPQRTKQTAARNASQPSVCSGRGAEEPGRHLTAVNGLQTRFLRSITDGDRAGETAAAAGCDRQRHRLVKAEDWRERTDQYAGSRTESWTLRRKQTCDYCSFHFVRTSENEKKKKNSGDRTRMKQCRAANQVSHCGGEARVSEIAQTDLCCSKYLDPFLSSNV